MSVGEPLVIAAALGAVVLWHQWDHVGVVVRALGALGVLVVGALGLLLALQPGGMAARWEAQEAARREDDASGTPRDEG